MRDRNDDGFSRDRDTRKRSRSPYLDQRNDGVKRHRSRSPLRHAHPHHHHHHHRHERALPTALPFDAAPLDRRDLKRYRTLLADYLDLQKQIDINTIGEDEVKGRWKSFLGKWNRGELAEGWYEPERLAMAVVRGRDGDGDFVGVPQQPARQNKNTAPNQRASEDEDEGDDELGPIPESTKHSKRLGPAVPEFQDLQDRRELAQGERQARVDELRWERKQDRKAQKDRLDELVPRADPGSRERQLEKKRETTTTNRAFRDAKEAGDVEVNDSDLMGEDGFDAYKARKKTEDKIKTEREIKKEEILRARAAEREERLKGIREKEAKVMEGLKELARQRFG